MAPKEIVKGGGMEGGELGAGEKETEIFKRGLERKKGSFWGGEREAMARALREARDSVIS